MIELITAAIPWYAFTKSELHRLAVQSFNRINILKETSTPIILLLYNIFQKNGNYLMTL